MSEELADFEISTHGHRPDRIHFCRVERTILSIIAVPGLNTRYPEAFALRRSDTLAIAEIIEDIVLLRCRGEIEAEEKKQAVIIGAQTEVHCSFTIANLLAIGISKLDETPVVDVPVPPPAARRLVYWLRDHFAQTTVELATKYGRDQAIGQAIQNLETSG